MSGMSWISPNYPFKVIMIKGVTGNATDKLEYVCEAEPGTATDTTGWRIKKLVYDSAGFQTQVLWASGDRKFDKTQESYAGYIYS